MRYIALLRGINVGGNTMIKMAELKASFETLGLGNVVSYVNSGNLAFDVPRESALQKPAVQKPARSKGTYEVETALISVIEKAIEKAFAKSIPVMIREQTDILRIIEANPFAGQFESHKEMHVLFLNDNVTKEANAFLAENVPPPERFAVHGREIYCHLPMGVADSYLGRGVFEKKLKIAVTARNWRTVEKLAVL
ncbi:MAG TPA: DUF1697 domain-containing protein [Pyrinomonadaceae bacterium]|nr:DUF1697 domain-containing protein [Pyrinomonadaceae bacterium]